MIKEAKMRAYAVRRFGEAPAILDLPVPAEEGAYLIHVKVAGVNPIDYKLVERLTAESKYPFVLGADFAGVVERAPAGKSEYRVGERIFGMARQHGAYAEYTAVSPAVKTDPIARIPEGVSDEQAAALPIPSITALASLEMLGVTRGQWVAVMGAAGGVGGYAVQIARSMGAHVIATVRGDVDEARKLGAEEVYDTKAGDVIAAIHKAHASGVDAVFDLVNGKDAIGRDAEVLKPGGKLVSTIYAADEKWFAERKITATNIAGLTNPLSNTEGLTRVARMMADGVITARITATVELEKAGEIIEKLKKGGLRGKALIRLS
jgi:NADPH:quinone reductase-like Zn-dependent oxidoreductase